MSKKFWSVCIIRFLCFTVPSLLTIFSLIGAFFKDFEPTLQSLGILGFILICCLCFSITVLLEVTGMIKIIDDLGKQYIEKNNKNDKSIYNFYTSYKKNLKNHHNKPFIVLENNKKDNKRIKPKKKDIAGYSDEFENYCIGVNHRNVDFKLEICYPDYVLDVIQEVSNIAISSMCSSISTIYDEIPVNTKLPKSVICKSINDFKEFIETKDRINIIVSFNGHISGCFLINFDNKVIIRAQTILESKYKKYYVNLRTMLLSYFKEMATILVGTGITSFSDLLLFNTPEGTKMGNIYIKEIITSLDYLDELYESESIIAVNNICRVFKLTSIQIYLLFSIHQTKVISDKLTLWNEPPCRKTLDVQPHIR